ncbi:MAG: hypothetical protein HY435_01525 [Candidatus Liptonbacteria bacterium]|nr:hypothetical protein [Candidatus Liptonbacteria bacterium]
MTSDARDRGGTPTLQEGDFIHVKLTTGEISFTRGGTTFRIDDGDGIVHSVDGAIGEGAAKRICTMIAAAHNLKVEDMSSRGECFIAVLGKP